MITHKDHALPKKVGEDDHQDYTRPPSGGDDHQDKALYHHVGGDGKITMLSTIKYWRRLS
jgi:hypothetical protein